MHSSLLHNNKSKFLGPMLWHKPDKIHACQSFAWYFDFPSNSNGSSLTDCYTEVSVLEHLKDKQWKALSPPPNCSGRWHTVLCTWQWAKGCCTHAATVLLTSALHRPGARHCLLCIKTYKYALYMSEWPWSLSCQACQCYQQQNVSPCCPPEAPTAGNRVPITLQHAKSLLCQSMSQSRLTCSVINKPSNSSYNIFPQPESMEFYSFGKASKNTWGWHGRQWVEEGKKQLKRIWRSWEPGIQIS